MRILLSNDDGIHAEGLAVLERVARSLSSDVWVVAPEAEQSGAGHSLTLHRPLRVRQAGEKRFAVDGTPTDCVLLAINSVMRDCRPDLILSGINRGGNLADDVTYSGTVAAAMEGTLLGVPAVALSQVYDDADNVPWATAEAWALRVIPALLRRAWPVGTLLNVNFPPVATDQVMGIAVVAQGKRKVGDSLIERLDPRGKPYFWIGAQRNDGDVTSGTDLGAMAARQVAVTPLCVDLTNQEVLSQWQSLELGSCDDA